MREHRLTAANDLSEDEELKLFLTLAEMRSFPK